MSVKVVDHPSRGRLPAAALLSRARDLLLGRLRPRLEDLLTALDDDLFARAEAARSDRAQQAFFDAMRLLRLERDTINRRFREELDAPTDDEGTARETGSAGEEFDTRVDALALLADEALEERLAVTTMSQRVERDCEFRLTLLRARLAHLAKHASPSAAPLPIEPRTVAGAFARAVNPLELDPEVRLVLFKRFEQGVLLGLSEFYEELDRMLVDAGVLPDLTPAQALGPRAGRPAQPARPSPPATEASTAEEAPDPGAPRVRPPAVGHAPQRRAPIDAPSSPAPPAGDVRSQPAPSAGAVQPFDAAPGSILSGIDPTEITQALATLPGLRQRRRYVADGDASAVVSGLLLDIASAAQLRLAPILADRSLDALPRRIDYGELLTRGAEKRGHADARLTEADEDLVNLVQALFDQLLGDDNLPVPIRALLARLQFPILRIALSDRSFLASEKHPARRFLNLLTRTGIGWVRADERAQDRLYQVIESTVDEAARGDATEFGALEQRIEEALAAEEELVRRATERVLEKERARLEAEKTRRHVERLVEHRCRLLPEGELRSFLGSDWQQVMYRAHQQEGPRSDAWKSAFAVLRTLSGADDLDGPGLHRAIALGLGRLGREAEQSDRDAARIIDLMLAALEPGATDAAEPPQAEAAPQAEERPEPGQTPEATRAPEPAPSAEASGSTPPARPEQAPPVAQPSPAPARREASIERLPDRAAIDAASALAVGDWIELRQDDDRLIRARLASVTEPPERCIFLNRRGVRMETLSRLEIAAGIESGAIRRLDSDQLFDNTLASVIGGLRDTEAAASA